MKTFASTAESTTLKLKIKKNRKEYFGTNSNIEY